MKKETFTMLSKVSFLFGYSVKVYDLSAGVVVVSVNYSLVIKVDVFKNKGYICGFNWHCCCNT